MKVLILGSTGLLGNTLKIFLKEKKVNLYFISRERKKKNNIYLKDFKNFKKLKELIIALKPHYIVNCLGITHYHHLYKDKKETKIINSLLPVFLSRLCLKNKIFLVHISTDCVYSGKSGNYSEKSKKRPHNLYGITKSLGEVKNNYTTTIRTSFIGPEKNKSKQLLNWFLKQNYKIKGYNNAFFSGLTSLELSNIIYYYFLKKNIFYNKILNIGGKKISKYKLLFLVSKIFKKKIKIIKYSSFKIDRSLNSNKFLKISNYKVKSWIIMLKQLKKFMILNNFKF